MKPRYDLLVVDIDGTLVNSRGGISAADKAAIVGVQAKGVKVVLSTGRVIEASRGVISELGLNGVNIFFDGAVVYDLGRQETLHVKPINSDTLKSGVAFVHANDIYLELYAIDRYFVEEITWADKIHREFFGLRSTLADFDDIIGREAIIKCELMIHNDLEEEKARLFMEQFKGLLRGSEARTPAYPEMKFINVMDPGVSKGAALETLVSYIGTGLDRVMAIGDGTNDLSLLEKAGLKIAMGNARDELKAIADHVTLSVDDSGVAAAIENYLL
ncbi:MAG: Cof-type HAD-IIB family hydrolase [Dehalogenimonas sp.]